MPRSPGYAKALLAPVLGALAGGDLASAAQSQLKLSLRLGEGYNDNVRLVADPPRSVTITTLAPSAELNLATETVTARTKLQAAAHKYAGDSQLDNVDVLFDAAVSKQLERGRVDLGAAYVRDSTQASELTETGLLQPNRRRQRATASAALTARLTERDAASVGYEINDVTYKDTAQTNLVPYQSDGIRLTLTHTYSPRTTAFVVGGNTRLRPEQAQPTSIRTLFAQAGVEHDLSELLKGRLSLGARRVRSDGTRSDGWLAEASLTRQLETGSIAAGIQRELNPTGSGELTQTDKLFASWSTKLSARLSHTLSGAVYRNETVGGTSNRRERYYRVAAGVDVLLTEQWAIEAELAHIRQEPDQAAAARANTVQINARYDWQR